MGKIRHLNTTLVMQTCNADGLLLKPDRPLAPMDIALKEAFSAEPTPSVFPAQTDSTLSGMVWQYLLNALRTAPLPIEPADLGCADCRYFAFEYFAGAASASSFDVIEVDRTSPLILGATGSKETMGKVPFELWILVQQPVDSSGQRNSWTILGEAKKYVAGSRQRFHSLSYAGSTQVEILGASGEEVIVMVVPPQSLEVQFVSCSMDENGRGSLLCDQDCSCFSAGVSV